MTTELRREGDVFIIDLGDDDNRIGPLVVDKCNQLLDEIDDADGPKALVTTATGKHFSNGLDTEWMKENRDASNDYVASVLGLCARYLTLGLPTVAAINGHAFGAGAFLALACDVRVMRRDRGFICLPEIDLGMTFPPGLQELAVCKLAPSTLNEAITTGRRYGGGAAAAAGFVDESANENEVVDRAVEIAQSRAGKAGKVLGRIKSDLYARPAELLRAFAKG